jgi:hypothetical protein
MVSVYFCVLTLKKIDMKKFITLFIIISSLSTVSCSKEEDATTTDLLLGRWYYVSGVNAVKQEVAPTKRIAATEKTAKYLEFKNGGMYAEGYQTGTVATDNSTYAYSKTDNTISLSSSKGIIVPITISKLNSNELVIVYGKNSGREGDTETYTKDFSIATALAN